MEKDKVVKTELTQRISRDSLNSLETKTIPVICPWCNSIFKMSLWEVDKDKKTGVTHGICPDCMEKTLKDAGSPKESQQRPSDSQPRGVMPPGTAVRNPIDVGSLGASREIRFNSTSAKNPEGTQKPEEAKQGAADKLRNFFKLKK
jgi:hypothetical protein